MTDFEQMQAEIETNERWLRGLGEPAAPSALADRVKAAIRLETAPASRDRSRLPAPAHWHGAFAAAAMLALCTTVVWRGSALERARVDRVRLVERLADSLNVVEATDAALSVLGDEIDAVCSSTKSEMDSSIDDLGDSIESVSTDSTSSM